MSRGNCKLKQSQVIEKMNLFIDGGKLKNHANRDLMNHSVGVPDESSKLMKDQL